MQSQTEVNKANRCPHCG